MKKHETLSGLLSTVIYLIICFALIILISLLCSSCSTHNYDDGFEDGYQSGIHEGELDAEDAYSYGYDEGYSCGYADSSNELSDLLAAYEDLSWSVVFPADDGYYHHFDCDKLKNGYDLNMAMDEQRAISQGYSYCPDCYKWMYNYGE